MRILVTNDDGIFAPGVEAMVEVLQHFGEVYVVCPDQERSAISHSITMKQPLKANPITLFGGNVQAWAVNGTPADCVKLGIEVLVKPEVDMVFSGINLGPNLGRDILYSGTIAGAVEATLYQIPAISVSLNTFDSSKFKSSHAKRLLYEIVEIIMANKVPSGIFLNVNLPHLSKELCRGINVVPLNMTVERYKYVGLNDPHGQIYYWLRDELQQLGNHCLSGDYEKLREGYITVTPVDMKWIDTKQMNKITRWFQRSEFNQLKEEIEHA